MLQYSPRIITDNLVMCLDPSQNKSYPTTDLPVKGGLVMWMDAADDSTFSYSSGTTVTQWRDKSGLNNHCTPLTAGPTRSSVLNSRKVLAFTTGQSIGSLSFTMETSANTVFVVSRLTGGTNSRVLTAYYNNWLLGHWGGYINPYYAEGWVYFPVSAADTVWRIHMGDWGGPSNDLAATYSNGTVLTSGSSAAAAGPKGLGINFQGGEPSTCEAAEIIVFNRLLSATERRLIHTYLGQKWGISNTDRSIVDLSNNNNHGLLGNGTVANMPTFNYYNKSLTYNKGESDTLVVTNSASFKTNNITIELYMKFNSTISSNTGDYIQMGIGSGVGQFYFRNENPNLSWNWYPASSASSNLAYAISNFSTDTYYLITLTGDSAGASKMYVNGSQVASASNVGSGITTWTTNNLTIGGYVWDGYSNTDIALTRIYSRVLSSTEIAQNYEAQKSKFANTIVQQGLVLNLDAGNPYSYAAAGSDWFDVSGNNNTSLLVGTTLPTFSNTNGGILIYDGDTQYSRTPSPSNNFAWTPSGVGLNNMTIDLWIKTTDGSGTILSKPWSGNGEYNFGLGHQGFSIVIGNQTNTLGFSSILTGNWINLVIVVSPTQYGAYINGVQNTALTNHGITNNTPTYGNGQIELTLMTLYPYGGGGNAGFSTQGNIGSFRIYNRVLSASEVLQNYNATKGRFGL